MIPKLIHLCWLSGDPYPPKIQYCIDSWKKHLPDYEIMLWDTSRFDVNSLPWTRQAFEKKKYAFVADYIRLYAVYNYGGIYFDSDVEVIRSFDDLLHLPYFAGIEAGPDGIEMASFGAEKGTPWLKYMMGYYEDRDFIRPDGTLEMDAMPPTMGKLLRKKYIWAPIDTLEEFDPDPDRICLLPADWFCAHPHDENGVPRYRITENTRSIHHYANSWTEDKYQGGPLHKLYFWITGTNWKFIDRRFTLCGTRENKEKP